VAARWVSGRLHISNARPGDRIELFTAAGRRVMERTLHAHAASLPINNGHSVLIMRIRRGTDVLVVKRAVIAR
jgi:hypothetical protein